MYIHNLYNICGRLNVKPWHIKIFNDGEVEDKDVEFAEMVIM